jgi:uncharacterized protein (DUF885 family)
MLYNEMVDIPPDRLLDIAYAQLHKDQAALSEAARQVNPTAPVEIVLKEIRAQHPTGDPLIPTARDELAGLRAFVLDHHIATIPSDLQPKVEETPGFQRATTAAAIDPPGPLERRATEAFYYVTPPDAGLASDQLEQYLEAYYFPGLEIISAHEVWPGQFMQYLTRRAHADWSLARQMADTYSTTEGWVHYTEQMMVEQGLGDGDPKLKIGQIEAALLRDCRFVASIEMHTKGKCVDDAIQIFTKECGSPEPEARREVAAMRSLLLCICALFADAVRRCPVAPDVAWLASRTGTHRGLAICQVPLTTYLFPMKCMKWPILPRLRHVPFRM